MVVCLLKSICRLFLVVLDNLGRYLAVSRCGRVQETQFLFWSFIFSLFTTCHIHHIHLYSLLCTLFYLEWYVDMLLRMNLTFSLHIPVTICVFLTSRDSDKYDNWMFLEYSLNFLEIGVRYCMLTWVEFKGGTIQLLQWNTESSRLLDRITEVCPTLEMWIISHWKTEALQVKITFRYFQSLINHRVIHVQYVSWNREKIEVLALTMLFNGQWIS